MLDEDVGGGDVSWGLGLFLEVRIVDPEVEFDGGGRTGGKSELEEAGVDRTEAGGGSALAVRDEPGTGGGVGN